MALLNAALAFAITMLILSMVTSVFVETVQRFVGLRERGLRLMLGHLYDRVIKPYIESQGAAAAEEKNRFLDLMTVNRAPSGAARLFKRAAGDLSRNDIEIDGSLLSRVWSGRRLAKLDVDGFMERLGASSYGDVIEKAMEASGLPDPDEVLKDLSEKFEAFGREASGFFERRARLISILVAIAVAWFVYVNPHTLFSTYLTKPEVTEKVLAMQEQVVEQYEKQIKALEEAAAAAPSEEAKEAVEDAKKGEEEARKKWQAAIESARDATVTLADAGVPIGWTRERIAASGFKQWDVLGLLIPYPASREALRTVFWLIVGGLLVGLGGPFWYDLIKSLSGLLRFGTAARAAVGEGISEGGAAEETSRPRTPIEHFKTAAAGRIASALRNDRQPPAQKK